MPKRKEKPNNSLLSFIKIINDNKFFAGVIMLTMNIGSKYISIELKSY